RRQLAIRRFPANPCPNSLRQLRTESYGCSRSEFPIIWPLVSFPAIVPATSALPVITAVLPYTRTFISDIGLGLEQVLHHFMGIASSFFEIGPVSFLDSDRVYGATA